MSWIFGKKFDSGDYQFDFFRIQSLGKEWCKYHTNCVGINLRGSNHGVWAAFHDGKVYWGPLHDHIPSSVKSDIEQAIRD